MVNWNFILYVSTLLFNLSKNIRPQTMFYSIISWKSLKKPEKCQKIISKSDKNVLNRVIGLVEFRKNNYFVGWFLGFSVLVNFCYIFVIKTLKIIPEKTGSRLETDGIGSRFKGHLIISGRLGSNFKTPQKLITTRNIEMIKS